MDGSLNVFRIIDAIWEHGLSSGSPENPMHLRLGDGEGVFMDAP